MSCVLIRILCSGIPETRLKTVRMAWGAWVVMWTSRCSRTGFPVGHDAARLDGGDVDARDVHPLADHHVGAGERSVRLGPVARLPVPDVVRLLLLVGADEGSIRLEGLERIDHGRQRLVVDLDETGPVDRAVARLGEDGRDLLALVDDVIGGQDHLGVRHEGRHPVEAAFSRSAPVITARTPGRASAAAVSIPLIVAWA